ncbi:MAG TPA: PHB depolymerase family esterase [Polyangiaceae bacterium]|nr:PHB depolymerase family esterase [Polyangiaceae bacterium]
MSANGIKRALRAQCLGGFLTLSLWACGKDRDGPADGEEHAHDSVSSAEHDASRRGADAGSARDSGPRDQPGDSDLEPGDTGGVDAPELDGGIGPSVDAALNGNGSTHATEAGADAATAAGDGQSPGDVAVDCPASPLGVGDHSFMLQSANGITYSYIIAVPKSVDPNRKAPLTVVWHALGSDPEEARSLTPIDAKAEAAGSLLVFPRSPDQSWDVGSCCTSIAGGKSRDEEVFARELVKEVQSKVCVDEKRIYTTGFSNGGMMSQFLACKMADVFAAATPMGSTLTIDPAQCNPSRPIPMFLINGTADPLVGYDQPSFAGGISVVDDVKFWATKNMCTGEPEQYLQQGKTTCKVYKQCAAGVELAFCSVEGMGHCVPGMKAESPTNCLTKDLIPLGMPNDDIDAMQMSSDFLARFALP